MTPLARKLAAQIRATGPITIAEYMAACLGDPEHGYYMHRDPFGRQGDFVTAPEISQMFGELIGLWCLAAHAALGSPTRFCLAELGPGRGTLMADVLRAARIRPSFGDAAEIVLVETSPRLRAAQEQALSGLHRRPAWIADVGDLPAVPLIVVANEFFDALPIRQLQRTAEGWAERMVGLDRKGGLAFGLRPCQIAGPNLYPLGAVVELRPADGAIVGRLAEQIAGLGGAALIIDYGHAAPGAGDTLQAVRAHRYDSVLSCPGEADLTAHVDFSALATAAESAGAVPRMVLTQREFLLRLGLAERAERLAAGKDEPVRAAVFAARDRLAGEAAMGRLFKVLGISSAGVTLPPFDTA